ncbi:unnamed protein product, partial [marine sediment metagenome]
MLRAADFAVPEAHTAPDGRGSGERDRVSASCALRLKQPRHIRYSYNVTLHRREWRT